MALFASAVAIFLLSVAPAYAVACGTTAPASVGSSFNGTSISSGDYIWFNAVVKLGSTPPTTSTMVVSFTNQQIVITPDPSQCTSCNITLNPPDSKVTYGPGAAGTGTTSFTGGELVTFVPWADQGTGNQFLSGLSYQVPATPQLKSSTITWTGTISATDTATPASYSLQWQWAAAVYSSFSTNYNVLGIKPTDKPTTAYANSDHAGTPENYKADVIGGARGGGGSNYTGSYSSTGAACVTTTQPPLSAPEFPMSPVFLAVLLLPLALALRWQRRKIFMG